MKLQGVIKVLFNRQISTCLLLLLAIPVIWQLDFRRLSKACGLSQLLQFPIMPANQRIEAMNKVASRLQALNSTIAEICRISGTVGASIGVLHRDEVIYTHNYGYRDLEAKLPTNEDTIYFIGSMTKFFTAAALGSLVEAQRVHWDTPISNVLKNFKHSNPAITENATIQDFLCHRTGLAGKVPIYLGEYAHVAIKRKDDVKTATILEQVYDFRTRWLYNNWGYALADEIIEKVGTKTWGQTLKERFLEPLGMDRTLMAHTKLDNVARAYMALTDGTPVDALPPNYGDGKAMEGAAGLQSSVNDLLKFYRAFIHAAQSEVLDPATISTHNPIFEQIPTLISGHIPLSPTPSEREESYAMGWVRTELPGPLGAVGLNRGLLPTMPIVGRGLEEPRLVLNHQGSIVDFLSSVHVIVDTNTAIVVLTNCLSINDAADWLGQLLVEVIVDNPQKNDYVKIAKESVEMARLIDPQYKQYLEKHRVPGTDPKNLGAYVGSYFNAVRTWHLEVFLQDEKLLFCFQGNRDRSYELRHYHYDTFSWLLTHDESMRRGLLPGSQPEHYLLSFGAIDDDSGSVDHVVWRYDTSVPDGEMFFRD